MRKIYVCEIFRSGKWEEYSKYKCNAIELQELKKNLMIKFSYPSFKESKFRLRELNDTLRGKSE